MELDLSGSETELDNNIIQQISDPLVHLVRNSVAHGIELPEGRREADKSEVGRVTLRAYHRGNHIYIEVEDDGVGMASVTSALKGVNRLRKLPSSRVKEQRRHDPPCAATIRVHSTQVTKLRCTRNCSALTRWNSMAVRSRARTG